MGLAHDLMPVVLIWNALKTARGVLGADMPEAEQAQELEGRTHKALTEGLASLKNLSQRDGVEFKSEMVDYVQDAVERCR